jgi:hypothetical protein
MRIYLGTPKLSGDNGLRQDPVGLQYRISAFRCAIERQT